MKAYVIKAHVRTTITICVIILIFYLIYLGLDNLTLSTWKKIGIVWISFMIYYAYKETLKEALESYKRKEELKDIDN